VALPRPGDPVPPLDLQNAVGRPAAVVGGDTLYAFFKTTCPTSELVWPYLDRIRRIAQGRAFRVIGVSQDTPEATRAFQERAGTEVDVLFDPAPWTASAALHLQSVPTLLLVGADGRARETVVGFQKSAMERLARAAADGRPAPPLFRHGENVPELRPG
jgi:peroxiredoxin